MAKIQRITPCLWFDGQAEAAVNFYTAIFPNSRITDGVALRRGRTRDPRRHARQRADHRVRTRRRGLHRPQRRAAFKFNEAISLQVNCDTQQEIDHYWSRSSTGGAPQAQQCGWLKDRYGLSWQVVPSSMVEPDERPEPTAPSA